MPNLFPLPVLADAGAVVGLLVLIFSVVGWLVNLANSQNNPPVPQKQRPRPPRPRRQGQRMQNEIDIFLKEVRGEETVSDDDVVVESVPPKSARQRRTRTASPPPQPPPTKSQESRRLGSVEANLDSHVGESLSSHHLASPMGEDPSQGERPDYRGVGEMVAIQKGRSTSALPVMQMLRDRQGLRNAILVNEILSKPKSLREENL